MVNRQLEIYDVYVKDLMTRHQVTKYGYEGIVPRQLGDLWNVYEAVMTRPSTGKRRSYGDNLTRRGGRR